MSTVSRLLVGWLVAALAVLAMDGQLPAFPGGRRARHAAAAGDWRPGTPAARPSRYTSPGSHDQPSLSATGWPTTSASRWPPWVAAAEQDATTAPTGWR